MRIFMVFLVLILGGVIPISAEASLEKTYEFLINDNPLEALKTIDEADQKNPDVIAARTFAAFELDSWEETIEFYRQLPKLYQELDGFQGIVIESHLSLGQVEEAEKMLDKLLGSPPEPSADQFPLYFQQFKKKKLDQWNRFYVAAQFYKLVTGNLSKSLNFYQKIKQPSALELIEMAEIYREMGDFYHSKTILINVLEQIQGVPNEKEIKIKLLPQLAQVLFQLGYYPETFFAYQNYFKLNPQDTLYRIPYAKVLMEVGRYDLALEQLTTYQETFDLTSLEKLMFLESLVKTDQFDVANGFARDWLSSEEVSFYIKLRIARLMVITKNQSLLDTILEEAGGKEIRSIEESQQLILLRLELGEYETAKTLANVLMKKLEGTVDGLLVLVDLYTRLSDTDRAYAFAEMGLYIDPTNPQIIEVVENYNQSRESIVRSIKLLKERLEDDPSSLTLQLDYAKNLIDYAIESFFASGLDGLSHSAQLKRAKNVLESIPKNEQQISEIFYLLGKTDYLLNQNQRAKEAYEQAIKLNPSDVKSYQHLALIYADNNDLEGAIRLVERATGFDPSQAELWLQLGGLFEQQESYTEAIDAYSKAKQFSPNSSRPYTKLAEVYLKMNNAQFAIANLERALEIQPKSIPILKLMLLALYNEDYVQGTQDLDTLKRVQLSYFDKLQALSPEEAQAMRERLGVPLE